MALVKEGTWLARMVTARAGDDEKDRVTVAVDVQLTEGPDAGALLTYNQKVDNRSAPYIARSLVAAGWAGKTLSTLTDDIEKAKLIAPVEIRHAQVKDGSKPPFAVIQSIGRAALKPLTNVKRIEVDALLRAAMGEDDAPPPYAGNGSNGGPDDSIPFCRIDREPSPIARVLR